MEDVVEAVAIRIIGIIGQLPAERLAVDLRANPLAVLAFDVDQFDLKTARKALAFGQRRIEAQRLGALGRPARLHLGEVGSRDLVEGQVELARDVRDIPEQVAQLFGHALLEESVCFAVAQMFLVFAQELAGFAGETQHGNDEGKDVIRALARRDAIGAQGLLLIAVEIHHRLLRHFI
jgi:hypothetical protein